MVEAIIDMADARLEGPEPPQARDLPGVRPRRRPAMRRQRCVLRRHRQSRAGLRRGPAGARRRHGDVLRGDRGARRHPSADARARQRRGGRALVREMAWYDAYLARGGADRSANTTPGNKKGGLANIVEKALGSIVKSGTSPISGCSRRASACKAKGLIFAATPASDFVCGTLQLASGMNLQVFTTGRGTPYGLAAAPVIKVATRTRAGAALARSDRLRRRRHRHRRGDDRGGRLGAVPPDPGRRERPQEDLGRSMGAAQRAGAVQSGAGDVIAGCSRLSAP